MATVSIAYRKDKLNAKSEAPIHIRIIKHRKISYVTTGVMVPEKYWDKKNKRIKAGFKNSARFNSFIYNKFTELQDQVMESETLSKALTSRQLKDKVFGKPALNFFQYADKVIEQYKVEGKYGTYDRTRSVIAKLKKYVGEERTLTFNDITPEFLKKYENYLRTELENKTNSIHTNLKFIRKVFNDAIRDESIEANINPFTRFQLKLEKTQREYLTEEELTAFVNCKCSKDTKMQLHQDMFVFAAYSGGMRVSDVLLLRWNDFTGTHINFKIQKTGTQLSIKLPPKALDIILKYKSENLKKDAFIFPMLKPGLNYSDPKIVDAAISSATAYINKNLKLIAKKAEIEKPISFHISRHTWATRALRKGITIDKVFKLMGHAQIRETQIYAKIVSEELDKAMDVFND